MITNSNVQYHIERARAELDLAYRAEQQAVAEAHMRLSALHMERARNTPPVTADVKQR